MGRYTSRDGLRYYLQCKQEGIDPVIGEKVVSTTHSLLVMSSIFYLYLSTFMTSEIFWAEINMKKKL